MGPLVKQDLAKLDKDPDTRRTAMDALKGYVEQLDVKSMPQFLEQVSETRESETSRPYAISLYIDVARVHKHSIVPFIPRIMASVVRSLPSSGGSQQLQQACAKVVSSVARYTVDPTRSSLYNEEILQSLCDPLIRELASTSESVAMGSAACLRALVESEKWKFTPADLVNELCERATMALGDKGTQTVEHMQLVRSLAKFNARFLQHHGTKLLGAGIQILQMAGGTGRSWEQRATAAQLLGSLVRILNAETLALELGQICEVLERCRLDRSQMVRAAAADALHAAKSFLPDDDLRHRGSCKKAVFAVAPASSGSDFKKCGRQRSLWRGNSSPQTNQVNSNSEESQGMWSTSPTSSTPSLNSVLVNSPSTTSSGTEQNRSPLFPAKQWATKSFSPVAQGAVISELNHILAHLRPSDSKENAPVRKKPKTPFETPSSMVFAYKVDDLPKGIDWKEPHSPHQCQNGCREDPKDDLSFSGFNVLGNFVIDGNDRSLVTKEDQESLSSADGVVKLERHGSDKRGLKGCLSNSRCLPVENLGKECRNSFNLPTHDCTKGCTEDAFLNGMSHPCERENGQACFEHQITQGLSETHEDKSRNSNGCMGHILAPSASYHSLTDVVSLEDSISPQRPKIQMTSDDCLLFTTPRSLVHFLQSGDSHLQSGDEPENDASLDMEAETLSESSWSVRDNPLAGVNHEDPGIQSCSVEGLSSVMTDYGEASLDVGRQAPLSGCNAALISLSAGSGNLRLQAQGSGKYQVSQLSNNGDHKDLGDCTVPEMTEEMNVGDIINSTVPVASSTSLCFFKQMGDESCSLHIRGTDFQNWLSFFPIRHFSLVLRRLDKARRCAEMFLGGALCVVVIVPIAIAVIKCLNAHEDIHVLVPT